MAEMDFQAIDQANISRREIHRAIDGQCFSELHTHLLGMGSAHFWLQVVLGWFIPRRLSHADSNIFNYEIEAAGENLIQNWRQNPTEPQLKKLFRDVFSSSYSSKEFNSDFNAFIESLNEKLGANQVDMRAVKSGMDTCLERLTSHADEGKESQRWFVDADCEEWEESFKNMKNADTITADVVFTTKSLARAFDLNPHMHEETKERHLISRLSLDPRRMSPSHAHRLNSKTQKLLKTYVVWNARHQKLQERRGWPAMHVMRLLGLDLQPNDSLPPAQRVLQTSFLNGFSMLDEYGEVAKEQSLEQYRGNFTPQFYPRRFELKDDLYEQDLYILQLLRKWEERKYQLSGVAYVEFSVSAYDILRPWVFEHLAGFAHKPFDLDREEGSPISIEGGSKMCTKFLAGFSRDIVCSKEIHDNACTKDEETWRHQSALCDDDKALAVANLANFSDAPYTDSLRRALELLEYLMVQYNQVLPTVCGIDWFGDEQGRPYIGFAEPRVLSVLARLRKTVWQKEPQNRFGIRIHGGEMDIIDGRACVPGSSNNEQSCIGRSSLHHLEVFFAHFLLMCRGLKESDALFKGESKKPFIRIGHGVAFVQHHQMIKNENSFLTILMDLGIPLELNLTSNEYLLQSSGEFEFSHVLGFLKSGWTKNSDKTINKMKNFTILCCDNDGVWPLDSAQHHVRPSEFASVPSEFARGIAEHGLRADDIRHLNTNACHHRFWQEKQYEAERNRRMSELTSTLSGGFDMAQKWLNDNWDRDAMIRVKDAAFLVKLEGKGKNHSGRSDCRMPTLQLASAESSSDYVTVTPRDTLLGMSCTSKDISADHGFLVQVRVMNEPKVSTIILFPQEKVRDVLGDVVEALSHCEYDRVYFYVTVENFYTVVSIAASLSLLQLIGLLPTEHQKLIVSLCGAGFLASRTLDVINPMRAGLVDALQWYQEKESAENFESLLRSYTALERATRAEHTEHSRLIDVIPHTCEASSLPVQTTTHLARLFNVRYDFPSHDRNPKSYAFGWSWSVARFIQMLQSERTWPVFQWLWKHGPSPSKLIEELEKRFTEDTAKKLLKKCQRAAESAFTQALDHTVDDAIQNAIDQNKSEDENSTVTEHRLSSVFVRPCHRLDRKGSMLWDNIVSQAERLPWDDIVSQAENVTSFREADRLLQQVLDHAEYFLNTNMWDNEGFQNIGKILDACLKNDQIYDSVRYSPSPNPAAPLDVMWRFVLYAVMRGSREEQDLMKLYNLYANAQVDTVDANTDLRKRLEVEELILLFCIKDCEWQGVPVAVEHEARSKRPFSPTQSSEGETQERPSKSPRSERH